MKMKHSKYWLLIRASAVAVWGSFIIYTLKLNDAPFTIALIGASVIGFWLYLDLKKWVKSRKLNR